jgi:AcrR family transcriptional regulator
MYEANNYSILLKTSIMEVTKNRQKYIDKAIEVFKVEGLRLSLDELADHMGITKKTLYNHFNSKDELLQDCIHSLITELQTSVAVMNDEKLNAVTAMRKGFEALSVFFYALSPMFFNDIKRLYPEMASTEHAKGFGVFRENVVRNLQKGMKEQIYRNDLDVELVSQFFIFSIFGFFISKVVNSSEYSAKTYFISIVDYHLRALVTEKGKKLI